MATSDQVSIPVATIDHKLDVSDDMKRYLAQVIRNWTDGPATLTLKRERPDKSQLQMGYYRGLVLPMITEEACGDGSNKVEQDRIHKQLKAMFLESERVEYTDMTTGEVIMKELAPSLGDLNTREMSDFTERVRAWALDFFGLVTPDPDPNWKAKRGQPA